MTNVISLTPKNWRDFQHYSNRRPPWIKLHRTLLEDYDYISLPDASKALAPMLWLLASEQDGGKIVATEQQLSFRLHMSIERMLEALIPLVENGFFIFTSVTQSSSKQDASMLIDQRQRERSPSQVRSLDSGVIDSRDRLMSPAHDGVTP